MLYKALVFCLFAIFGTTTNVWAQAAEKRVALVIGIGSYEHVPGLRNPAGDAKAIGEALQGLKFQVISLLDPDKRSVERALRDFGDASSGADIAIIFYAGHAVQVDGHNYMIPKDARLEAVRDLSYDAVPLELFVRAVSDTKKAGVLIVDACRDNPFVKRLMAEAGSVKVSPGLSRIDDAPTGTLVAMSTRADHVAEDGAGTHSPYAQALLDELAVPGIELRLFFGKVSDRVRAATSNRQEPYVSHTLGGELVFLNPQPPNQPPVVAGGLTLETSDTSSAIIMGIPVPTDPDSGDRLMVEVTGLPKGGRTMIDDRPVHVGDLLNVEQLRLAAFDPDGTLTGDVGSFDFKVSDSRGGTSSGRAAGGRVLIRSSVSRGLFPWKGSLPVRQRYRITPNAHTSVGRPTSAVRPAACSGDM